MDATVDSLLQGKSLAVGLWLAALFLAERLRPAAPARPEDGPWSWRRGLRNAGLWLPNVALSAAIVVPVSVWAATAAPDVRPAWLSGGWALAFDIVLLDFWIYWWHRANHRVPLLWRFHEVHHLDRFLDTTSAIRFHFGEVALSAAVRAAVVIAFAIPLSSVLVFETLVLASAIFHHSNVALPPRLERALSALIITPSIHWVHHHRKQIDTDSNYGTILSVWDPLFRTRNARPRTPDMTIGVEGQEEERLSQLLLRPFLPRR